MAHCRSPGAQPHLLVLLFLGLGLAAGVEALDVFVFCDVEVLVCFGRQVRRTGAAFFG